jgi:hypothetical protein
MILYRSTRGRRRGGRAPGEAMAAASDRVTAVAASAGASPVLVAYPLGFDWMFLY